MKIETLTEIVTKKFQDLTYPRYFLNEHEGYVKFETFEDVLNEIQETFWHIANDYIPGQHSETYIEDSIKKIISEDWNGFKFISEDEYVEEMMKYVKENDDWKDQFVKFLEKLS